MASSTSETAGVDGQAGQLPMPRDGSSVSTCRGPSSFPASEDCGASEAIDFRGNDGDMSDPVRQESCATNAVKEVLSVSPEASTLNWQFSNQADITGFVMSVLNSGGNSGVIGDNDRYSVLSLVKYLEDFARVTSLENTSLLEAHRAEISQVMAECEKGVTIEAKMGEVSTRLEKVTKESSEALSRLLIDVQNSLAASKTALHECKDRAHNLQAEVREKAVHIENAAELENQLRLNQHESATEVQRLKSVVKQKETAMEEVTSERDLLMAKCSKLEALIEQGDCLDSKSSGAYAVDGANPVMFQEVACKIVDKATDALIEILLENSIPKGCDLEEILDLFERCVYPAKLGDFPRPRHVQNAWSHRICSVMFRGFEHWYFDMDGGHLTSPLDAKLHALKSFECFQLKGAIPSLECFKTCITFRRFCEVKHAELFPRCLLRAAYLYFSIEENWEATGDTHIFKGFLDVAKAVWLLHELAFAFDPPATILRMACGDAFDKQFHEPVAHDEGRRGDVSKVVLMMRPAFRVRNTIIRSRVLLGNNLMDKQPVRYKSTNDMHCYCSALNSLLTLLKAEQEVQPPQPKQEEILAMVDELIELFSL